MTLGAVRETSVAASGLLGRTVPVEGDAKHASGRVMLITGEKIVFVGHVDNSMTGGSMDNKAICQIVTFNIDVFRIKLVCILLG